MSPKLCSSKPGIKRMFEVCVLKGLKAEKLRVVAAHVACGGRLLNRFSLFVQLGQHRRVHSHSKLLNGSHPLGSRFRYENAAQIRHRIPSKFRRQGDSMWKEQTAFSTHAEWWKSKELNSTQWNKGNVTITTLSSTDGATTLSRTNLSGHVGHVTIFS